MEKTIHGNVQKINLEKEFEVSDEIDNTSRDRFL